MGGTRDCDDDGGLADATANVDEGWSGVRGGLEGGSVDAVELRLGLPMGLLLILLLWLSPGDDADDPGELPVESSDNATLVGLPRPSSSSFLSTLLLPWRSSSSNGSVFVVAMVGFY